MTWTFQAKQAAPLVSIDGSFQTNVLAVTINSTGCFSADTFLLALSIDVASSENVRYWATVPSGYVEVFSSDKSVCLVTGMIDSVSLDVLSGVVKVSGRDLSSLLIDASPERDYVNQNATEIVTSIALKHGLIPNIVPVIDILGRFFGNDFTRLSISRFSRIRSEWDLIVQLARELRYNAYVRARTLYFEPLDISSETPLIITPAMTSVLRVNRALWVGLTPTIQMSSWNTQEAASYVQREGNSGNSSNYIFGGINMTDDQISKQAEQYLNEISEMQQSVMIEIPWNDTVMPNSVVILSDTGAFIDGIYRVRTVERHFNSASGSIMSVSMLPALV